MTGSIYFSSQFFSFSFVPKRTFKMVGKIKKKEVCLISNRGTRFFTLGRSDNRTNYRESELWLNVKDETKKARKT